MRFLGVFEIINLHTRILRDTPGAPGIRDLGALKSAVAQPRLTFGGEDLYPTLFHKAAALSHSLVLNHPFVDANKRVGHAALETMLVLNGFELTASVDEQEALFLNLASGAVTRPELSRWIETHVNPK
jgi:death-on-curing protein